MEVGYFITMINFKYHREEDGSWKEDMVLQGHSDWVRDVAFAPNLGVNRTYLASCSQDKTVIIWTSDSTPDSNENLQWSKKVLGTFSDPSIPTFHFTDVIWRVSWSLAGNLLAVSCGDNKITLWKESLNGDWVQVGDVNQEIASEQ
jgi:protein transport protein SEC13